MTNHKLVFLPKRLLPSVAVCCAACALVCCTVDVGLGQVIFLDDFDGTTVPAFTVTPVAGTNIPGNDMPWGVNDSGQEATWESAANPFSVGTYYAYINDDNTNGSNGTRFMTTDDDTDPNGYGASITGQVTTFSFDFFEPTDVAGNDIGNLGFGYSNADDLNSGERVFRGHLNNGSLGPDNGLAGAAVAYDLDTVNTVWMIANDSASSVANYSGGETLDPAEADVWISLAGDDPIYAFTVGLQNAAPHGVGFRTFSSGDIEEFYINNVLLVSGVSFDRSAFSGGGSCDLGDVDCDGNVDLENDFAAIQAHFRRNVALRSDGDLTGDGLVSLPDFVEWKTAFLIGGGSLAGVNFSFLSVPEPSSVVLATLALLGLVGRRKRRGC
jgi:PEP-CTERM motif